MATRNLSTDELTLNRIEGQRGLPMRLVSESGLYKIITRSDKAEAHEFQEWVTRVVLPTLRKDGMYIVGEERHSVEGLTAEEIYKLALVLPTEQLPVITTHLSEQLRCLRGWTGMAHQIW